MDQAANSKYLESRAASASEFHEQWIENLPMSNTSGQMLSFRSPENLGIPSLFSVSGYALVGVDKGEPLNGEFTHDGLLNGSRSILCVKEIDT
jgi:hypothetical protein